jgi:hypothetical protein
MLNLIEQFLYGETKVNISLKGLSKEEMDKTIKNLFLSDSSIFEISVIDKNNKKWKISRTKFLRYMKCQKK